MAAGQRLLLMMATFIFNLDGVYGWNVIRNNGIINGINNNGMDNGMIHIRWARHIIPPPTIPVPTLPPVFDRNVASNVTVTASKTAMLSCIVHNLGNNTVSWIRHRDLHILSVGSITYTNDERFEAVSQTHDGNWVMKLRFAMTRDSGQYDCQISTTPPISRTVILTVIEPHAKIVSGPEMHVGVGSAINLTCIVSYSPQPPTYLHWYYRERMVREDGRRIWIKTILDESSISQLVIHNAAPSDQGVYTCSPAHSIEHSITLHVLTGEYPAAMQGGSSVTCKECTKYYIVTLAFIICITIFYV